MTTSETTWSVIFMSDPSVDRTVASALPTNEADLDARPCSQVGNVYAKFFDEEHADAALKGLDGRFYAGQKLLVEFSPVTDFREARCAGSGSVGILIRSWLELTDMRLALSRTPIYRCRQYDEGGCKYGPYCNFMHVKKIGRTLAKDLEKRFGKVTNVEFCLAMELVTGSSCTCAFVVVVRSFHTEQGPVSLAVEGASSEQVMLPSGRLRRSFC